MPSGGARVGAGRKRTAEVFAKPIRAAEQRIADSLPNIVEGLIEIATTPNRDVRARVQAASYLMDRLAGKPVQPEEISGPDGGAIQTNSRLAGISSAALTAIVDELEAETEIDAEAAGDDRGGEAE